MQDVSDGVNSSTHYSRILCQYFGTKKLQSWNVTRGKMLDQFDTWRQFRMRVHLFGKKIVRKRRVSNSNLTWPSTTLTLPGGYPKPNLPGAPGSFRNSCIQNCRFSLIKVVLGWSEDVRSSFALFNLWCYGCEKVRVSLEKLLWKHTVGTEFQFLSIYLNISQSKTTFNETSFCSIICWKQISRSYFKYSYFEAPKRSK